MASATKSHDGTACVNSTWRTGNHGSSWMRKRKWLRRIRAKNVDRIWWIDRISRMILIDFFALRMVGHRHEGRSAAFRYLELTSGWKLEASLIFRPINTTASFCFISILFNFKIGSIKEYAPKKAKRRCCVQLGFEPSAAGFYLVHYRPVNLICGGHTSWDNCSQIIYLITFSKFVSKSFYRGNCMRKNWPKLYPDWRNA